MGAISFSISSLFAKAFGYNSPAFEPEFSELQEEPLSSSGSPLSAISSSGSEYFLPVKISTLDGSLSVQLQYPVIRISARKRIVETELTERRGTVKELINIQDWDIVIRGVIVSPLNVKGFTYPEDEVKKLRDLWEKKEALLIENRITDLLLVRPETKGSDNVVIFDIDFPEMRGVSNVRAYELRLRSDAPFNLIEIE